MTRFTITAVALALLFSASPLATRRAVGQVGIHGEHPHAALQMRLPRLPPVILPVPQMPGSRLAPPHLTTPDMRQPQLSGPFLPTPALRVPYHASPRLPSLESSIPHQSLSRAPIQPMRPPRLIVQPLPRPPVRPPHLYTPPLYTTRLNPPPLTPPPLHVAPLSISSQKTHSLQVPPISPPPLHPSPQYAQREREATGERAVPAQTPSRRAPLGLPRTVSLTTPKAATKSGVAGSASMYGAQSSRPPSGNAVDLFLSLPSGLRSPGTKSPSATPYTAPIAGASPR